jgi:hypothetical protein
MIRVIIAEACLLAALFWVGEDLQLPLILATAVILIPVIKGSCGLYQLLGWSSCEIIKRKNERIRSALIVAAVLLVVVGSFASHIYTKNILIEDLEVVNESCNHALQSLEGDGINASIEIDRLEGSFAAFRAKYSRYRPVVVKTDGNFSSRTEEISSAISGSKEAFLHGDLASSQREIGRAGEIIRAMMEERR